MGELLTPNDLLGTASYVVIALSYLMTSIFWLRVSAVAGLFLEIAYFEMAGGDLKIAILWGLAFIGINLYQLFWLIRERASLCLPEKDAPFLREALIGLTDPQIARLLAAADWKDVQSGETLTQQGAAVDALYFLCSGRANVVVNGSFVTYLEKGAFVGEMAYLTGMPATATVAIDEPSRILVLSKSRMAKITSTDGQIAGIIHQLLGRDLATKMRQSNARIAVGSVESVWI
jgi:hypothetical protein